MVDAFLGRIEKPQKGSLGPSEPAEECARLWDRNLQSCARALCLIAWLDQYWLFPWHDASILRMSGDLAGVRAKIERAKDQVVELDDEIGAFIDSGPYEVRPEYNAKNGEDLYRVHVLRVPPLRLGVIIGEMVHDLRSALDHVAWQLTKPAKRDTGTGFPIFSTPWGPGEESESAFLGKVDGMSDEAVAIIKRLQPHQPGKPLNKDNFLYRLHKMNIRDKHRLLNVVGGAAEQKRMTIGGGGQPGTISVPWDSSWGWPQFDGVIGGQAIAPDYDRPGRLAVYIPAPNRVVRLAGPSGPPRPFKDGAVLTRVIREPEANVKVDAQFAFFVAFDEPWPGNGEPVVPALEQFVGATEKVVESFASLLG